VPYYLVIEIAYAMIFGWVTLLLILTGIMRGKVSDAYDMLVVEQKVAAIHFWSSNFIFVVLILQSGLYIGYRSGFDKVESGVPEAISQILFLILYMFQIFVLLLYIYIFAHLLYVLTKLSDAAAES